MPDGDDRIRDGLRQLAGSADDSSSALERIGHKRRRRQVLRRMEAAGLAVVVVVGTVGGTLGLMRVFRSGPPRPQHPSAGAATNGRIAFIRVGAQGSREVWTANPDGSALRRLTGPDFSAEAVTWSPDGTKLAAALAPATHGSVTGSVQLWVMDPDGGNARQVTQPIVSSDVADAGATIKIESGPLFVDQPAWSPLANWIAFAGGYRGPSCPNTCSHLFVVHPDGTGLRDVTALQPVLLPLPGPRNVSQEWPAWAPDGRRIAFVSEVPRGSTIERHTLTTTLGGQLRPLFGCEGQPSCVLDGLPMAWSPDGSTIAAFSNRPGHGVVYVGPLMGRLVFHSACGSDPCNLDVDSGSWSPDGRWLLFSASNPAIGGPAGLITSALWLMRADGTSLHPFLGTFGTTGGSWQPVPAGSTTPAPENPQPTWTGSNPPSGIAPVLGHACGSSELIGDFDGDGQLDTAVLHPNGAKLVSGATALPCPSPLEHSPLTAPAVITVAWGDGAQGSWAIPDCGTVDCHLYMAGDIDHNGTDEAAIVVDTEASTEFIQFYELPASEAGPNVFRVVTPNGPGDPLRVGVGGSVKHVDVVTCRTESSGDQQLLATHADLSSDGGTWTLQERVWSVIEESFRRVGVPHSSEPADPNGRPPTVEGTSCFHGPPAGTG